MGTRYSGDLDWHVCISSKYEESPERFGGVPYRKEVWYFDDKEPVEAGVQECIEELGANKEKFDTFFNGKYAVFSDELVEFLNLSKEESKVLFNCYRELLMGRRILECIDEKGHCQFESPI